MISILFARCVQDMYKFLFISGFCPGFISILKGHTSPHVSAESLSKDSVYTFSVTCVTDGILHRVETLQLCLITLILPTGTVELHH